MIGGVTRCILPHLSGVPHRHVNRPLVLSLWTNNESECDISFRTCEMSIYNMQNKNQAWSEGETKNNRQRSGTRAARKYVTDVLTTFWRLLWSITEQTRGNMESIRFIQCREKKKRHTYLVSLDCSRICAILDIFEVVDATFRLGSLFSSLSYLHTVSQKRFSLPSLAQSTIIAKTFCESLVEMTHDGNCCESVLLVQALSSRQDLFLHRFFHLFSL